MPVKGEEEVVGSGARAMPVNGGTIGAAGAAVEELLGVLLEGTMTARYVVDAEDVDVQLVVVVVVVVQVVDDGVAVDELVRPQATSSVHGSEITVTELLLVVVHVVDDGVAVDELVTPQALSSVHGSEITVTELLVATSSVHGSENMVAELLLVTDETGYG
ncbi:MAG: hypothetical protein LQ347_006699, partial [Umbilicaria vellea]